MSNPRPPSSVRVSLACVAVALLTSLLFNGFGRVIDQRRLDQLRISRMETACYRLTSLLGAGRRGGSVAEFERKRDGIESSASTLVLSEGGEDALTLRRALVPFFVAAGAEVREIRRHDLPAARLLDANAVGPAYVPVSSVLSRIVERNGRAAEAWTRRVQVASSAGILAWALLVSGLFTRYQAKIAALVRAEAETRSVEASGRRMKSLVQNNSDVILLVTADGVVTMVSDACERAWGWTAEAILGRSFFEFLEPVDRLRIQRSFNESLLANLPPPSAEGRALNARGEPIDFEVHFANLLGDPDVGGVLLTVHDLTERKRLEQEMAHHAFHDRLTALPNRALFLDRLTHRLKAREVDGGGFAVLFIDLDNFKVINDSLGHEAGDTLLIEVAARLQSVVRPLDTVARMGGDEFTVILDEALGSEEAIGVAERILKALVMPLALGEREVFVTCSIGVVMAADSASDAAGLLRDADTAMYEAKGNGKAGVTVFESSMNLQAINRMELESDLRVAIEEEQFFLAYQPIVDMETERVREVEALIRWQHPVRGVVPPLAFIPLAEETGLVVPIGRWAMREAFAQLAEWNRDTGGREPLRISVNVSGRQLQEKGFASEVDFLLTEIGIDPRLVELEVTETAMLKDMEKMKEVLGRLRGMGLRIAIDDFGTGYSSMAYLSQLPVDKLKIDRSFVIPLGGDPRADGVVQAMITMARTLGLGITGEGVETEGQLTALRNMGCDLGQGYLFDRPLSADSIARLVANGDGSSEDELRIAA